MLGLGGHSWQRTLLVAAAARAGRLFIHCAFKQCMRIEAELMPATCEDELTSGTLQLAGSGLHPDIGHHPCCRFGHVSGDRSLPPAACRSAPFRSTPGLGIAGL